MPQTASIYRAMGSSGLARAVVLPVTAIATAVTTYITIAYAGAAAYGYIALIGMLFQLIPFADLGMGAGVTNSIAKRKMSESAAWVARETVKATFRALLVSAFVLLALLASVGMFGLWPSILGLPPELSEIAGWAVLVCIAPFAISVPFGIGQRILLGDSKNHVANLISGLGPLIATGTTALLILGRAEPLLLAMATPVGVLVVSVVCFAVSFRSAGYRVGMLWEPRELRPGLSLKIWSSAGPMLVIMITVPIALQSGRLILAHVGSAQDLASYSIAAQFYTPAVSLISTAGIALWPMFSRLGPEARTMWAKALRILALLGLVAAVCYAALIQPVAWIVSGQLISVDPGLGLGFAALLLVTALHQPSAYLLTSPRMLVFQASCSTAMVLVAVPTAIWLTGLIGAAGPAWAMTIAVGSAQMLPCILRSRKFFAEGGSIAT